MNSPIQQAIARAAEIREAGKWPQSTDAFQRFAVKNTRRTAIAAFCCHCIGGPDSPGYRADVRACPSGPESSLPCPLYEWRPYK